MAPTRSDPTALSTQDADWRALFLATHATWLIAPWNWMGDAEHFGVQDPETGEVGWCTVLGSAGELMGVAVYLGDAGYDFLRKLMDEEIVSDEGMFGQDALVLMFGDREELSSEERAQIRRTGVAFRGRGAWPQFQSHATNRVPRLLTPEEVLCMAVVLEQFVDVAARSQRDPALVEPDADGRRLVRVRKGAHWIDERVPEPPVVEVPVPEFDRVRAERLRRSLEHSPLRLECDLFPSDGVIHEPGRDPYAPALFIVVDAEGGAILRVDIGDPVGREAWAQEQLLRMVEEAGHLPATIYLQRRRLHRVLAPLCAALAVPVDVVDVLDGVEEAREFIAVSMAEAP